MHSIKWILLRLYTFIIHPCTLFYYSHFKGTVFYPHTRLKKPKHIKVINSVIGSYSCIKAFPLSKVDKILINVDCSYIGDRNYISGGIIEISKTSTAPNVFIGSYRHSIVNNQNDTYDRIVIEHPKFIGQNVSIFGNCNIPEGVVIGAASVVCKNLEKNAMYVGNPVKKIKYYDENSAEWKKI